MTRRLAMAILLTVWATLIAGGTVAYALTRAALLEALDASLETQAESAPELVHTTARSKTLSPLGGDRYDVVDDLRRPVTRWPATNTAGMEPRRVSALFSSVDGRPMRTVTVRAYAAGDPPRPVTVVFTGSAGEFDAQMNRLAVAFALFGAGAGLLTAWVALSVSRAALRPLKRTAQQIASVDERHLDRRIDAAALPPELSPMAANLNDLLARLEAAFAQRDRFLAGASHELRTPVAALVTALDVCLRHPRDADAYRRALESCRRDANELRRLVERLMEQVRSQNLSHDEPAQEVDVADLLRGCLDNVAPLAEVRQVSLVHSFAPPLRFAAPPGRLRSVITNLLSNAIEYNRAGGSVEVDCRANGVGLELCVRDTGLGIAPEHLPHLFEPFYRGDAARRHDEDGHMGLGLSLVQAHVQAMSGTCTADSELGRGTTFTVRLPPREKSAGHGGA